MRIILVITLLSRFSLLVYALGPRSPGDPVYATVPACIKGVTCFIYGIKQMLWQDQQPMEDDKESFGCLPFQVTPTPRTSPLNAPGPKVKEKLEKVDSTTGNSLLHSSRKLLWPKSALRSVPIMESFPDLNLQPSTSGKKTLQSKEQGNIKFYI